MGLILEISLLFEVILGLLLLFLMFYMSITKTFEYWKEKGVPYVEPSFPFGNTKDVLLSKKQIGEMYNHFYKQFENERYFGVYDVRKPVFVVRDPHLIKQVLIKDFHHFQDRMNMGAVNSKNDYLAKNLFNLGGQEWKHMRVKLSPTFTSGKMKLMFSLMEACGDQLTDYVTRETVRNANIDVKDILARFTLDIIASCAFGLEANSLQNRDCEFYQKGLKIFDANLFRRMRRLVVVLLPASLIKRSKIRLVSKELTEFYTGVIRQSVEYRRKNNETRNDFLNILMEVGENKHRHEKEHLNGHSVEVGEDNRAFTIEEMAAQAFVFFAAGFETASSTMSFCLYELAQNPDIQDKLFQEIKETLAKHGGKPTYQALQEMPYMDKVINETLRRYASVAVLNRVCTEDYKVPDSNLVLEKGTPIVIPTFAIHHDPKYYEDPFKFDPERFTPEKVRERNPFVHLPFGEGPRMCIGMRFGLLQTKIGLTRMIANFEFGLTPQMQIPIPLNKVSVVTQPEKPILLRLSSRV